MGTSVYTYVVLGLPIKQEAMYESTVCCAKCKKQGSSKFCPDCGEKIEQTMYRKPEFEPFVESERIIQAHYYNSKEHYLIFKKYTCRESDTVRIPITDLALIDPTAMKEFEELATKLGIWDKDKFGVYLFNYFSC
jgi:hypothetical protein